MPLRYIVIHKFSGVNLTTSDKYLVIICESEFALRERIKDWASWFKTSCFGWQWSMQDKTDLIVSEIIMHKHFVAAGIEVFTTSEPSES